MLDGVEARRSRDKIVLEGIGLLAKTPQIEQVKTKHTGEAICLMNRPTAARHFFINRK